MKLREAVIAVLFWKLLVVVGVVVAMWWWPLDMKFTPKINEFGQHLPYGIWNWGNFDGQHYMKIAAKGYLQYNEPFFPLYPIAIWLTHTLTRLDYLLSGLLVSHLAFGACLVALWQLLGLDLKASQSRWQVIVLWLVFPTSFFYGAVYNDSLFMIWALGCLWFGRRRQWWWASVCGALATLTRLNGLALAGFLGLEYVLGDLSLNEQWQPSRWWRRFKERVMSRQLLTSGIMWSLLIPLAFLAYVGYVHVHTGDWHALFSSMKTWNQDQFTFPPVVFWRYLKILWFHSPALLTYWVAVIELLAVLLYCAILVVSWRKLSFSYWFFIGVSILIPWLTGTFAGMPRYALHIYPIFLALYLWLDGQSVWVRRLYLLLSLVGFMIIIGLFTRGYFVT